MNHFSNNVFSNVQNAEVKKKSSPSTPRDFFEKLYGNVDSFKKNESKEPNVKVPHPVPVKVTSSRNSVFNPLKSSNAYERVKQSICNSVASGVSQASLHELQENSSGSDVDVESENGEDTSVSVFGVSDTDAVRSCEKTSEGRDKFLLLETSPDRSPWLKQCSQTLITKPNPTTATRIPQPILHKHHGRTDETSPFYVRHLLGAAHEGHFPPGLTAFCKSSLI